MLRLAVVVTLAFSVGVLVAGPIYADSAREAILSSSLATANTTVVNTRFIVPGGPDFDWAAANAAIERETAALPVDRIVPQGRGPITVGPEGADPTTDTSAVFRDGAEDDLPGFTGEAHGNRE